MEKSGGASQSRVCYQRDLTPLVFRLLHWFKSYGNFTGFQGFCLVVDLHGGGPATN